MVDRGYVFSKKFFTGWVTVGILWLFFSAYVSSDTQNCRSQTLTARKDLCGLVPALGRTKDDGSYVCLDLSRHNWHQKAINCRPRPRNRSFRCRWHRFHHAAAGESAAKGIVGERRQFLSFICVCNVRSYYIIYFTMTGTELLCDFLCSSTLLVHGCFHLPRAEGTQNCPRCLQNSRLRICRCYAAEKLQM